MYYVYCNEGGAIRERTKHCAETKKGAQALADELNRAAENEGAGDWLYFYVRKFTPKVVKV